MVDEDSSYAASGGTVAQSVRQGGMVNVYVDCVIPAGSAGSPASITVSVAPDQPIAGVADVVEHGLRLEPPVPNPFRGGAGAASLRFTLPVAEPVRIDVLDPAGRRVVTLVDGTLGPGAHEARWDGRGADGAPLPSGLYFARLAGGGRVLDRKLLLLR
jgi:hypothetical protein